MVYSAHVAASHNAVRCMELILPKLTNVNITDRVGRTCLHLAAYFGHYEMVELLIVTGGLSVNMVLLLYFLRVCKLIYLFRGSFNDYFYIDHIRPLSV